MDSLLCDELLIDIFHRLPPASSPAVSLVSRRWLRLRRLSTAALSLSLPPPPPLSLPSFISLYPFLSSLSICSSAARETPSFDQVLLTAAAASPASLKHLRFYAGPITSQSSSTLVSLSSYKPHLVSLSISLSRPLNFSFLSHFPSLSEFSVSVYPSPHSNLVNDFSGGANQSQPPVSLRLECLSVAGIGAGDGGFEWLWRSLACGGQLRRLRMRGCEAVGDGGEAWSSFRSCLRGVEEVELRTCRSIVDGVLLRLSETSDRLRSLLVYDGGSRGGLLDFIVNCRSNLEKMDLRLPLDLGNEHLFAMKARLRSLKSLKLQSCCLVTGEGLEGFGAAMGGGALLQELALINCDVVEKVPGLPTTLCQNLRHLRRLNLSYNEMLNDKEFISMMASCKGLVEISIRGCARLTRVSICAMIRNCRQLESADIKQCSRLETDAVEMILESLPGLRRVQVEQSKVSDVAVALASSRWIEVVV